MRSLRRFRRDETGVSTIEFAVVLPVMAILLFGGIETTNALEVNRKVSLAASTAADLVAQAKTLSNSNIQDVFNATRSIMAPYDPASLSVIVSSITYVNPTDGSVAWSDATPGTTPRTVGSTVHPPTGVLVTGTSVIMAEVTYQYNNPLAGIKIMIIGGGGGSYSTTSAFNMSDVYYDRPRRSVAVARTP